jgi:hypothetical protein
VVEATLSHLEHDEAISLIVGNDIFAGASPEVSFCNDYEDSLGHLTEAGAMAAGYLLGNFYRDWKPIVNPVIFP